MTAFLWGIRDFLCPFFPREHPMHQNNTQCAPRAAQRRLLTTNEVAAILNVPRTRVYRLVHEGILADTVVRLGRQIRFASDRLDAFIASGGQAYAGGWRKE